MLGDPARVDAGPLLLLVGAILIAAGSVLVMHLRSYWSGGPAMARVKRQAHLWGDLGPPLLAVLPLSGFGALLCGLLALLVLANEFDGAVAATANALSYFVVPAFFAVGILFFSVVLTGRPRTLVPPSERGFRGILRKRDQ